jgi:uncharacterized heparinase superfamily protein
VAATAAGAVLAVASLAGCGSSSSASKVAIKQTCQQVAAVLSDGPDPTADPVGYAQAQVLPLRQLHASQRRLQVAIDKLATAYSAFSSSDGRSAKVAVAQAGRAIDVLCPGATQ